MNFVEMLFLVNCVFAITPSIIAGKELEVKFVKFEEDASLDCVQHNVRSVSVRWIRNSQDVCTPNSTWCHRWRATLLLRRVIRNGNYTCERLMDNGSKWNASEIAVVVENPREEESYCFFGSNITIDCLVKTPNLEVRLVRDDNESCTPDAKWCLQRNAALGSSKYFDILDLKANHTYTCEAYSGSEKLPTVSVHHVFVGSKPKIHEFTFSPPGLQQKGTEIFATASFYSPLAETKRLWDVYYGGDQLKNNTVTEDEYSVLAENEYESKVSLGHVYGSSDVWLNVSNVYGYDLRYITIRVGVKHGERCDAEVVCMTNDTYCDTEREQCLCRSGYVWNSSVCKNILTMLTKNQDQ